jgi:cytochrome c oxidase assembly protein subunit 16
MSAFQSKKWRSAAQMNSITMRWRRSISKHPFLLFGLPFMGIIVGASFMLTPVTAIRYEKHDRKVRGVTREEEEGLGKARRRLVDMREEYYKLAAKDIDDWEQKRVKRLPGESDGEM